MVPGALNPFGIHIHLSRGASDIVSARDAVEQWGEGCSFLSSGELMHACRQSTK